MKLFFSVGEPSGDQHAAQLIQELSRQAPHIQTVGFGGPLMQEKGFDLHFQLTDLAVMGIFQVIPLLWKFIKLINRAGRYFNDTPPDAVVLVDFPGFNWWVARKAKKAGIPVFYYMPPQLWAWNSGRIRKIRKFVDHVLCGLSFEHAWYQERGVSAEFVGHPFFDEVANHPLDTQFLRQLEQSKSTDQFTICILPGSRNQEVQHNFSSMLLVMSQLFEKFPHIRFLLANFKESQQQTCRKMVTQQAPLLPITWAVGKTSEMISAADCCFMVSGSISLELLARNKPAVVIYRLSSLSILVVRAVLRCPFITLPNLIAGRELMPEFLFGGNPAPYTPKIVNIFSQWIENPVEFQNTKIEMDRLRQQVATTGGTHRAATAILNGIKNSEQRAAA